jgi:tryptophanyl-tRNA synthetase
LDAFDPEKEKLEEMKAHYRRGGLGDSIVKKHLLEVLQNFLTPIRERRKQFVKDPAAVLQMLFKGTALARETTSKTLDEVRKAMLLDYGSLFS